VVINSDLRALARLFGFELYFYFGQFTQYVADVLAQPTFDAGAELPEPLDVVLHDAPTGGCLRFCGLEGGDPLFYWVVPAYVSNEIFLMSGKVCSGSTVIGCCCAKSWSPVIHISFGCPLISAEHEPQTPALQFHLTARTSASTLFGSDLAHCGDTSGHPPSEAYVGAGAGLFRDGRRGAADLRPATARVSEALRALTGAWLTSSKRASCRCFAIRSASV
jgi:hypothetical protein